MRLFVLLTFGMMGWGTMTAQVNISSGSSITESFSIGTSATAPLPTGWKVSKNDTNVRTVDSYGSAGTATEYGAGNSMASNAPNGIYNFAAGDPASSNERAVGGLSSTNGSKSVNVYLDLYNNGSSSISNFTISYNVEKYRNGSNAAGFSIQMYYSTDGSTWTSAGSDFLTSFAADGNSNGFASAPGATVAISSKTLNVSLAASSHLYLAWNYSVTSGTTTSSAQALGIDDVSITANGPVHNVTQNTYFNTIQAAVTAATAGNTIEVSSGTYPESVIIDKSLTIKGAGSTCGDVIIDGGNVRTYGFKLNDNVQDVTIKKVKIINTVGDTSEGGIFGSYNDGVVIDSVCLENTSGRGAIFFNGPIDDVTLTNNEVSGSKVNERGIVIWNGDKTNINISNNYVHDIGGCCGIELQDGNASAVTMNGNTVKRTGDSGMSAVGLNGSVGANTISNNTIEDCGRFGIEVKNPDGSTTVDGNTVSQTKSFAMLRPSELRDIAGIAVMRRGVTAGNVDVPQGVTVTNNTVSGYIQDNPLSQSEGFGIVIGGVNHTVSGNTLTGNDVGIQQQAGHTPYPGDGNQNHLSDQYFGRDNSPIVCGNTIGTNTFSGNGTDTRAIGVGSGVVTNLNTSKVFCSIQPAIDDATTLTGHTIEVGSGTFNENVVINKGIVLKGNGQANTILTPTTSCTGTGISISAPEATVEDLTVTGFTTGIALTSSNTNINNVASNANCNRGIELGDGTTNVVINNSTVNNNTSVGIRKGTASVVSGFTLSNSEVKGNNLGFFIAKNNGSGGTFDNVTITNSDVSNNAQKGMYFEALSNALIDGITMDNSGNDAGYGFNAGIDINLKYGAYSNITIQNSEFTNCGAEGTASDPESPVVLGIKARDDGSYSGNPATLTDVIIKNNLISGPENGIRFGEFGTTNAGPSNVSVTENHLAGGFANKAVINRTNSNVSLGCNWHGSTDNSTILATFVNAGSGNILLNSILTNGTDSDIAIGFQPTSGACVLPVVITDVDSTDQTCATLGSIIVTFEEGTSPYNIAWTGGSELGVSSPYTISGLSAGTYGITVTDANGFFSTDMVTVNYLPVTNTTQSTYHATIQAAIDAATTQDNDVIEVCAGIYPELVTINKVIDLRGPKYGTEGYDMSRGTGEAIVVPPTSKAYSVFTVNKDGVSINGFTIDGDNTAITTTDWVGTNGADIDAQTGIDIWAVDGNTPIHNVKVENNIIQNFTYVGIENYGWGNNGSRPEGSGNLFKDNLIKDLGIYNSPVPNDNKWGMGVLLYDNNYARVEDNVMTNVRTGIQTGNFYKANPGLPDYQVFKGNTIQARRSGIFHNLFYSAGSSFTLENNTITALARAEETPSWNGILLSSQNGVTQYLTGNNINGAGVSAVTGMVSSGINVWHVNASSPGQIAGGTIENVVNGVFVNNFEGYNSNSSLGGHAAISNVTIKDVDTGVKVWDGNNTGSTHAKVSASINTSTITASNMGVMFASVDDHKVSGSVAGSTITAGSAGIYVDNASATDGVSLTSNTITVTNREVASVPTMGIGLRNVAGTSPATVDDNDVSGAFYGYGAYNVNTTSRTSINGGTVSNIMQGVAILNTLDGVTKAPTALNVHDVNMNGFSGTSSNPAINFHAGIYTFTTAGTIPAEGIDLAVNNVTIDGTGKPSQASGGIYLADFSGGLVAVQTVTVDSSDIVNNANRGVDARGKVDLTLTANTLNNNGHDAFGTGGNYGFSIIAQQNATVTALNNFINLPATSTSRVYGLFNGTGTANQLTAHDNSILLNGNSNVDSRLAYNVGAGTMNATCNWWGTGVCPVDVNYIQGTVLVYPYLVSGVDDNASADGFQPVALACSGAPVVIDTLISSNQTCAVDGSIEVQFSGGIANYTISWTGGTPVSGITGSPYTITGLNAGSYTVTVADINGCTDVSTVVVGQNMTAPVIDPLTGGTLTCSMPSLNVTVTATGSSLSYAWSGGAPANAQMNTFTAPGTYTVTVTDGVNGCTSTASVTIMENKTPPTVDAGSYGPLCENGAAITLGGTPMGGTWTGTGVSGNTFDPSSAGDGDHTLTYSYTDMSNGCSASDMTTIHVDSIIAANAGLDMSTCYNSSVTMTPTDPTPGVGVWSGGAGSWSGNVYTPNPSEEGTTITATFTVTNGACSSQDQASITIEERPQITTDLLPLYYRCEGTSVTFTVAATGSGTLHYVWKKNGLVISGAPDAPSYTINPIAVTDAAVYTVEVTGNCTPKAVSSPSTLNVYSMPSFTTCSSDITQNTDAAMCTAVVNYTTAVSSMLHTPSGNSPYSYSVAYEFTGATTGSGSGDGSGSTFNKGVTTVTITATNACGSAVCTFTVTIEDHELPNITCPSNQNVMANVANCEYQVTGTGWDPTFSDNCNGATVSNNFTGTATLNGAEFPLGSTVVVWTVTDASGNTSTCSFTVTVETQFTYNYTFNAVTINDGDSKTICEGEQITIGLTGDNTQSFVLKHDGNTIYSGNVGAAPHIFTAALSDAGTYELTVTNTFGCDSLTSFTLGVHPAVVATAVVKNTFCDQDNGSIDLTMSSGTPPYTYTWSNGATTEDVTGLAAGTYTVTISDMNSCSVIYNYTIIIDNVLNATTSNTYATIQAAINDATAGDVIEVCAGTYNENVVVNKSLDIRGANYGVDPNSGTRGAESIITFPTGSDGGELVIIRADDVSMDGFTIDGENNVTASGSSGLLGYGNNISVTNNIVSNFNYVSVWFSSYHPDYPTPSGNNFYRDNILVSQNYIHNADIFNLANGSIIGYGIYMQGSYGSVTDNVVEDTKDAIQVQPYQHPNSTNTTGVVSGNSFEGYRDVIWYNAGGAGVQPPNNSWSINNNYLTGIAPPTGSSVTSWLGLRLHSYKQNGLVFNFNSIDHGAGLPGDFISNTEGSPTETLDATCNWYGTTIANDIASNISGNVTYTPYLVIGTDDQPTTPGFQPVAGACSGTPIVIDNIAVTDELCSVQGAIEITFSSGTAPYNIAWTGPSNGSTNGISSPHTIGSLPAGAYSFTITDANMSAGVGNATVNYLPVTNTTQSTYHATIQAAIDAATAGDVIEVCAGTYNEELNVNKPLTINGAQQGVDPRPSTGSGRTIGGANESIVIAPKNKKVITIAADNVIIDGLQITQSGGSGTADAVKATNSQTGITFRYNIVSNSTDEAIQLEAGNDYTISFNYIANPTGDGITLSSYDVTPVKGSNQKILNNDIEGSQSAYGSIYLYGTKNVEIAGNVITTKSSGIAIGSGGLPVSNTWVHHNDINTELRTAYSALAAGIAIDDSGDDIVIENNSIVQFGGYVPPALFDRYNLIRVGVAGSSNPTNVEIHNNYLSRTAAEYYLYVTASVTNTVDATCNWFSTNVAGDVASRVVAAGSVNFMPYLNDGTDTDGGAVGFEPTAGACTGCPDGRLVTNARTGINYCTIQSAIDDAQTLDGDTLNVGPGTYVENVIVNKELTILGPNATIDACSGTRVGEAIITTAVSDIAGDSTYSIIDVQASNVTISGFTIDGDNTSITTGYSSTTSADIDIAVGITRYVTGDNITVTNNIIKNVSYIGVELYDYPAAVASAGNTVANNRIEDLGTYDTNSGINLWGIGILLYNNQYAAVTHNCLTNVRVGIQTGNFHRANPGASTYQEIANNTISARRRGIFHNLFYSAASPFTVSDNTITGLDNANETLWDGMLISSHANAVQTILNNTVDGSGITTQSTIGINIWNDQVAPVVDGGSVSNVEIGVNVNNFEGYNSNANTTLAEIKNINISATSVAGVRIHDNPSNTNGARVFAEVKNSTIVSDSIGVLIIGADAGGNVHDNTVTSAEVGIYAESTNTSSPNSLALVNNAVSVSNREVAGIPTVGITLRNISGSSAATVDDNDVSGSFYGYGAYNVNTTSRTTINGGTVSNIMQGVAILNTLDGVTKAPTALNVHGVNMNGFNGTSSNPAINFHAGIYTFTTAGTIPAEGIDLAVNNVTIDGTGKPSQASGGIYLADFSGGSVAVQTVTVDSSDIVNNANRGVDARGKVDLTLTANTLNNNGHDAFGTGGNYGFSIIAQQNATVTALNNFINLPATSTSRVYGLFNGNGTANQLTAHDNSILLNGNSNVDSRLAYNVGAGTMDATCNWWGTGVCPVDVNYIQGTVLVYPYLVSGVDDNASADGFQPVTGACSGVELNITSITAAQDPICADEVTTLTANGVVGEGATVTWYTGPNGTGTNLGTGLTLAGAHTGITYYARVTGDCGPAKEASYTLTEDGPVENINTGRKYCAIQSAIDDSITTDGDTIVVAAGTYVENVQIYKELTLIGANAGFAPDDPMRGPESIIMPASNLSTLVEITADNVSFDGFTLDGANPAMVGTGILLVNTTIKSNAFTGIDAYNNNTNIQNNIVKNILYSGIGLYGYNLTTFATEVRSGNTVSNNYIQNLGTDEPVIIGGYDYGKYGLGILAWDSYSDVENNKMDNVKVGIQTDAFIHANPEGTNFRSIADNIISARAAGIFNNVMRLAAEPFTISDNTVTGLEVQTGFIPTTQWNGIVLSIQHMTSGSTVLNGNDIDGGTQNATSHANGIKVWSVSPDYAPQMTGDTISNVDNGVFISNWSGYGSDGPNYQVGSSATITNVTMTSVSKGVNVEYDSSKNNKVAKVTVNLSNSKITATDTGVDIHSDVAGRVSGVVANNTITSDAYGVSVNTVDVSTTDVLTINTNTISVTGQDKSGVPTMGIALRNLSGSSAATVTNNTVSGAFFGYGVFNVNTTPVTTIDGGSITGIMQGVAILNTLDGVTKAPTALNVHGVNMNGFTGSSSNPAINFHAGIYTYTTGGTIPAEGINLAVNNVTIDGTGKPSQASGGIYLADFSGGSVAVQTVTVDSSDIVNNANRGVDARGKVDLTLTANTLNNNGHNAWGTGGNNGYSILAQREANVTAYNNFINMPASSATPAYGLGLGNGSNNQLVAHNNSILMNGNTNPGSRQAYNPGTGTINATCNWWGPATCPGGVPVIQGVVEVYPYLISGVDDAPASDGFQPEADACALPGLTATVTGPVDTIAMSSGHNYAMTICSGEAVTTSPPTIIDPETAWCSATRVHTVYTTTITTLPPTQVYDLDYATAHLTPPTTITPENHDGVAKDIVFTSFAYYDVNGNGAYDAGDEVEGLPIVFTLTVNPLPEITCPGDIAVVNDPGVCGAVVTYTTPTFVSYCDPATVTLQSGLASGVTFPVGVTTNVWMVTDKAGNTATCSFTVTVTDTESPTNTISGSGADVVNYTCGDTVTYDIDLNSCDRALTIIKPVWADNCSVPATSFAADNAVTLTDNGTYVSATFPIGLTLVTFQASDVAGNISTCTLHVLINDNVAPAVTNCPTNITVAAPSGVCEVMVSWTGPTFTDNCSTFTVDTTSSPTPGLSSGSFFPIGVTTVTYTATDADGNTTTCQFTVEVTGTCGTLTELTTNMFINASNFVVNQDRDAIVTVDNIGANPTSGQIQFALTKPANSFFSTTIPAINYTADVLLPGGIATNNGDWSCTNNGIFYLCTSKPGVVINPGNSSIIGMNFKADGPSAVPNSKAQAVSSLGTGTGGDQNIDNNRAKSNLIIN